MRPNATLDAPGSTAPRPRPGAAAPIRPGRGRVQYLEGRVLTARDLMDEQESRIAAWRRHRVAHHGPGVLQGLDVSLDSTALAIQPGNAVDAGGRELRVRDPIQTSAADVARQVDLGDTGTATLAVALVWARRPETRQSGGENPGPESSAVWIEETRLVFLRDEDSPGGQEGGEIVAGQDLGDAVETGSPVRVGRVRLVGSPEPAFELISDPEEERYGFLRAASVGPPSGAVGFELARRVDAASFAIRVAQAERGALWPTTAFEAVTRTLTGGTPAEGRQTDALGDAQVRLGGGLVTGGDLVLQRPATWDPLPLPPESAAPGQVYRTTEPQDEGPVSELRFEIGNPAPGGVADKASFAVVQGAGPQTGNAATAPLFTVIADGSVVVPGNLVVQGDLVEAPIQADSADPRLLPELVERWRLGRQAAIQELRGEDGPPVLAAVKLSLLARATAGSPVAYGYFVANPGPDPLTVTVIDNHYGVLRSDFEVPAAEVAAFFETFPVPDDGRRDLETEVTVLGVTPDGRKSRAVTTHTLAIGEGDDLRLVPGLGRRSVDVLLKQGIGTLAELAGVPLAILTEILPGLREATLVNWQRTAGRLVETGLATVSQVAAAPLEILSLAYPGALRKTLGLLRRAVRGLFS